MLVVVVVAAKKEKQQKTTHSSVSARPKVIHVDSLAPNVTHASTTKQHHLPSEFLAPLNCMYVCVSVKFPNHGNRVVSKSARLRKTYMSNGKLHLMLT